MTKKSDNFFYNLEKSAVVTIIGIIMLFSGAVIVTLIAPSLVDPSWTSPTSSYQVQMHEVADPNLYISSTPKGSGEIEVVYHLKDHFSLLAFQESTFMRIVAPEELKGYITSLGEHPLKLTSRLLLLRQPQPGTNGGGFDAYQASLQLYEQLQAERERQYPNWKEEGRLREDFSIFELYSPESSEAFALAPSDIIIEEWVDSDFVILDEVQRQKWHSSNGVIYLKNPREYRISHYTFGDEEGWRYDPDGEPIASQEALKSIPLGFVSRATLIEDGEKLFAAEGCWYCHTDQTRTLVQDLVLNGSDSFPAPPSSANEYIYQKITFPGTRRIGPDLSRVGIKRPSRDWHKSHFWSPQSASKGSIMPSFQHFFDSDPRGSGRQQRTLTNYRFEAMFQYLMTKGTRITPPTEAWWLGLDPLDTTAIIEGRKVVD